MPIRWLSPDEPKAADRNFEFTIFGFSELNRNNLETEAQDDATKRNNKRQRSDPQKFATQGQRGQPNRGQDWLTGMTVYPLRTPPCVKPRRLSTCGYTARYAAHPHLGGSTGRNGHTNGGKKLNDQQARALPIWNRSDGKTATACPDQSRAGR